MTPTGTEAEVCADIAARQANGIQKYGVSVAENPLSRREWAQHAYEELTDAAVYLKRMMSEPEGPALPVLKKLIEKFSDDHTWEINSIVSVNEVTGIRQECELFGHEYVNQSGGGIAGDDYSGWLYLPIEGQYLKIWYAC